MEEMCMMARVESRVPKENVWIGVSSTHVRRAKSSAAPKAIPIEPKRMLCHQTEGRNLGIAPFPLKGT